MGCQWGGGGWRGGRFLLLSEGGLVAAVMLLGGLLVLVWCAGPGGCGAGEGHRADTGWGRRCWRDTGRRDAKVGGTPR